MAPSKSSRSRSDDAPATADDAAAARSSSPAPPAGDDDGGAAREEEELRRGPWTVDEDLVLVNYITGHGEGRWNSLAQAAGLKRTGKSCRLRWLNYLRPDVKRGNFTADEQLLILDLHSRYGNRWSKIAQHLPGRTDNEIKNYWRTRVQKHAKQLNCDAGSERFKDAMRYLWMPHLVDDVDRGRPLLHAAERQLQAAVAGDQLDGYDCYYAAAALSGTGVTSSSSDSFATASESYDAFPAGKWERPSSSSLDDAGGLYAAGVRAGEVLLSGGGGEWAQAVNQQGLWPEQGAAQVVDGGGAQLEDAELSGWVQNFSTAENFWTLEGI